VDACELDRLGQAPESGILLNLVVGDHLGRIHAGERVVELVFQQARRADRDRPMQPGDQRAEVADQFGGELGALERVRDAVIGQPAAAPSLLRSMNAS
jgi:hypothetical protein